MQLIENEMIIWLWFKTEPIRLLWLFHQTVIHFPFDSCEVKHQNTQIQSSVIGAERQDICCTFKLQTI